MPVKPRLTGGKAPDHSLDAVVVGGGVSGLTAALRLAEAGADVLVLEARSRAGGRVRTLEVEGRSFDAGADEVHEVDTHVLALARELDVPLVAQAHTPTVRTLAGGRIDPPLGSGFRRLLAELRTIHAEPGDGPDQHSVAGWLREAGATPLDLVLAELLVSTAAPAVTAEQASLRALALEAGGEPGQALRFPDGSERLVDALAGRVGKRLVLARPVSRLRPEPGSVTVEAGSLRLRARRVVLAVPLWSRALLPGAPPPPAARYGVAVKSLIRFPHALPASPDAVVSDGLLGYARRTGDRNVVSFSGGRAAARMLGLAPATRSHALAAEAAAAFGATPAAVMSVAWPRCTLALAPGQLDGWGDSLRRPRGRVHLAGAEASAWPSLIEGAVSAGERAAAEVLAAER